MYQHNITEIKNLTDYQLLLLVYIENTLIEQLTDSMSL